jgi:hypothetical protein
MKRVSTADATADAAINEAATNPTISLNTLSFVTILRLIVPRWLYSDTKMSPFGQQQSSKPEHRDRLRPARGGL